MDPTSRRPGRRDHNLSALTAAIEALDITKKSPSPKPAKAVFGSVSTLLATIRDSKANKTDYAELGVACADVCAALDRGINGRQAIQLNPSVLEAIDQLTTSVSAIQRDVKKLGERSRHYLTKNDKDAIAAWKVDLNRILHVFDTELAISTHAVTVNTQNMVSDIHRTLVGREDGPAGSSHSTGSGMLGESPPPRPRKCFGRDDLVERIVNLAESLTPIALVGAGGIGKTSISLVVLHHDRIKKRFGNNRWFIRCDQFPASLPHLLARLSKAIGAGIENPPDLASLRPFLSSEEMMIIFDNAESIMDPQGPDGREIYRVLEELSQFDNICLVITSRITTIPPSCETFKIPTLPAEAGYDAFYTIYKHGGQSDSINGILKQLDFHPLSVTLLATVAQQNDWDNDRLAREWEKRQTGVLQTEHQMSLASAIELSMASPMFEALGPDARELLEVVAFYPQGVNENNVEWLFPTIPNATHILDKFRILSLAYRSDGFVTMLAPLRDYLRPKDPQSSPLLCTTKAQYFTRLLAGVDVGKPGYGDGRWIVSEDVNVEHLLGVFVSLDPGPGDIWDACIEFMIYLQFHKPRPTMLRTDVEKLPDNHPSKPRCLARLGMLSGSVGNCVEKIQLLDHALKLFRERGDDSWVAFTLRNMSSANQSLGYCKEGIRLAREALGIYERLDRPVDRIWCLNFLARVLERDGQLDAAEEVMVDLIKLLPEKGQEFLACNSHHTLGDIYCFRGEQEKAFHHFKIALEIASPFDWHGPLFCIHFSLAYLSLDGDEFGDAHSHTDKAMPYALNNPNYLGHTALARANIWFRQQRLEDARSEVLRALELFKRVGAPAQGECSILLQKIDEASNVHRTLSDTASAPPSPGGASELPSHS